MTIIQFSALSLPAQVQILKDVDQKTAPMWMCNFADAYFKFNLGGLIGFPQNYIAAWHVLSAYRKDQMLMTATEIDQVWSTGCGQKVAKCYHVNSYTHS